MKKQRVILLNLLAVCLVMLIGASGLSAEEFDGSIYGHISHVDGNATLLRQDKTEHKAVVNLPVAPGDQIYTSDKGRIELQFDNGTIIRLDKDSRLKVTTVMAPSLTTKWKITTLQLMRGRLSSINQSYNREMFQIITPNAAVELKRSATAYIDLRENGDTFLYAKRGKFKVMYGEDIHELKTDDISGDKGFLVTADHKLVQEGKVNIDFLAWNEYINRNFKDLHYGVSKVPKKIYRFNKGLVYWAEKWSSLYGEWVYDDLFGYVWKPADELFSFSRRPFFHANFVRVNGQLFLVPQQAWGWVPAHMGTWVWNTKRGWTWIPGDTFNSGFNSDPFWRFSAQNPGYCCFFPTLEYWIRNLYGGYDLYYTYRDYGIKAWRTHYQKKYNIYKKNPLSTETPKPIREIISKLNKKSVKKVKAQLGIKMKSPEIEMEKVKPFFKAGESRFSAISKKTTTPTVKVKNNKIVKSNLIVRDATMVTKESDNNKLKEFKIRGGGGGQPLRLNNFRDFNPDTQWALNQGFKIIYSSRGNEIICPNLGLSSKTITRAQRASLIGKRSIFSKRRRIGSGYSSSGSSVSNSGSATLSTPSAGNRKGSSGQTSGLRGGAAKDK